MANEGQPVPAIAEPDPITIHGGRLDGARARIVDTSSALLTVVIYVHPETGDTVSHLSSRVTRPDAVAILAALVDEMRAALDERA